MVKCRKIVQWGPDLWAHGTVGESQATGPNTQFKSAIGTGTKGKAGRIPGFAVCKVWYIGIEDEIG